MIVVVDRRCGWGGVLKPQRTEIWQEAWVWVRLGKRVSPHVSKKEVGAKLEKPVKLVLRVMMQNISSSGSLACL